jgi:hypothetical protein
LLRYVVLIGYTEELWFRGLWFAMCRHRFVPSVVLGSVIFGLSHSAQGWQAVWMTAWVGGVFASARYCGAALVPLALVHGVMDWLNLRMLPGVQLRIERGSFWLVVSGMCLLLSGVLLFLGHRRQPWRVATHK